MTFQMPPTTGPLAVRREARMLMGEAIERMSQETGYRFGPRGWAYYAEGLGLITKGCGACGGVILSERR